MSISEAKGSITSTEFLRWNQFFEDEVHNRHREDWNTAIIAYQVYLLPFRIFGGKAELDLDDFLLKFQKDKPAQKAIDKKDAESLAAAKARISKEHKAALFGALGLGADGKPLHPVKSPAAPPSPKAKPPAITRKQPNPPEKPKNGLAKKGS